MVKHVAIYARLTGTEPELLISLRHTVENRGDSVAAIYVDDGQLVGRGKYAGWRNLLADLDAFDLVAIPSAGDIPGKTIADLLKILPLLRYHRVGLYLHDEQIDTSSNSFALLDIIVAYRKAKLSQAIRKGQARAVAAGKRLGRPSMPSRVRDRIQTALADGDGIRSTARRFSVSPASVINIRRSMVSI